MTTSAAPLTLYAWGNELDRVEELLYEGEGELTPELEQALEEVTLGFKEKAERVALYVRNLSAEGKAIKEEEDRLRARRKARETSAQSLKTYLEMQMLTHQIPRIEGKLVTLRIQKNPPAVSHTLTQERLEQLYEGANGSELVVFTPASYSLNARAMIELSKYPDPDDPKKSVYVSPLADVEVTQGASLRIA